MQTNHLKLRERVKELNCLYKISKAAWEAKNDIAIIVARTLDILPGAMQFPAKAEASITIDSTEHCTPNFHKSKFTIESALTLNGKGYGKVRIGYRLPREDKKEKSPFLQEEKDLLKTVARELSLFIKRAEVE